MKVMDEKQRRAASKKEMLQASSMLPPGGMESYLGTLLTVKGKGRGGNAELAYASFLCNPNTQKDVLKQGWLWKKAKRTERWLHRYVALRASFLTIAHSEDRQGSMSKVYQILRVVEGQTGTDLVIYPLKHGAQGSSHTNEHVNLRFASCQDRDEWKTVMLRGLAAFNVPTPSPSLSARQPHSARYKALTGSQDGAASPPRARTHLASNDFVREGAKMSSPGMGSLLRSAPIVEPPAMSSKQVERPFAARGMCAHPGQTLRPSRVHSTRTSSPCPRIRQAGITCGAPRASRIAQRGLPRSSRRDDGGSLLAQPCDKLLVNPARIWSRIGSPSGASVCLAIWRRRCRARGERGFSGSHCRGCESSGADRWCRGGASTRAVGRRDADVALGSVCQVAGRK
eukprot:Tamp_05591.p1 GENE.Tamp_05591~~Tamp_05591.p1  ORF type:complete len:398 (+),score=27.90 Tamp_05591:158-1351(+)